MSGAAGAGSDPVYADEVFNTFVYTGTGGANTVNTGLDIAGEGGLVWVKTRTGNRHHMLFDTERGANHEFATSSSSASNNNTSLNQTFTSTGFTFNNNHNDVNNSSNDYVAWSFRKAKGFFDVVTFTQASGTPTNQRISHSLGSAPGMIWMKCTSATRDWFCYHRSLGKDKYFKLNDSGAAANATNGWGTSEPDATEFGFNANEFGLSTGSEYIAYLFAHDVQSFGEGGDQSIIKCGTFSRSGSSTDVDIGFEPQFVFHTMYEGPSSRGLVDNMRGFFPNQNSRFLKAETTNAENNTTTKLLSATGFEQGGDTGNYIYMAIRRPDGFVGKPVELGTDVFGLDGSGAGTPGPSFISNFPVDFGLTRKPAASQNWYTGARVLKDKYLATNTSGDANTDAEMAWDYNNGFVNGGFFGNSANQAWMWKRHAGFDTVAYTGNGTTNRQIKHNLGQKPEMIWFKRTDSSGDWYIFHDRMRTYNGNDWASGHFYMKLNAQEARQANSYWFMGGNPTTTTFQVWHQSEINGNGYEFMAFLFSSVEGVSKVGWYTGTGSDQTITTGFQPRFVFIKRADSGDSGFILDTTRGWASGNDNYLRIENNAAQVGSADFGNPVSTGFFVKGTNSGTNTNTGHYIYYAHA